MACLEDECLPEIGWKVSGYLKSSLGAEETETSSLLLISLDVKRDGVRGDRLRELGVVSDQSTTGVMGVTITLSPSG
jgi:hypothetical protein